MFECEDIASNLVRVFSTQKRLVALTTRSGGGVNNSDHIHTGLGGDYHAHRYRPRVVEVFR